jgi:YrbI family 3-deoxy-D-manno-octulosonate 8-phosphate phosphatase
MVKGAGVVAIVPARGGSKSIPRKNIRLLGGVPLLAYSIEAGRTARAVDRVIVSTDDEEIATIARRHGAEVPFMRPASLGEDATPDLPVFQHALQWLAEHDAWRPEIVVQLRPTSPLRPPDCVDAAIRLLRQDRMVDSVRGVTLASQNPYKMWHLQSGGLIVPLLETQEPEPYNRPRQELQATYWQSGHVDAIWASTIRKEASMSGTRIKGLVLDSAYACDIDTDADWRRVEWMLAHFDGALVRPGVRHTPFPEKIRLIVFDFDGVLTDNRVWMTGNGQEWVACNRSDGMGLSELRRLGMELLVLSGETDPVVGARCRKLQLAFEQGVLDKGRHLREMLGRLQIDPSETIYVGNDINDLDCMRLAGCGVAVADAHPDVIGAADMVLSRAGGDGAVRELCDRLCAHLSSGGVQ